MKIKFVALLWLTLGVVTSIVACSDKSAEMTSTQNELTSDLVSSLETLTVAPSKMTQEIKFDGVIEALNQATISAQTSGRVIELPVDVGDFVNKGELIIRLTDTEQQAHAASAQAKFNEAQAQHQRLSDMLNKKLVARAEFDKAESAYKSAEASLYAAQEAVSYTKIYAPYAGIVVARMTKVGEAVVPGTPLISGLSLEHLRAQVNIPQAHIGLVRQFKQARVLLPNGKLLATSDIRISPSADTQTHSFNVLVNLPSLDPNGVLGTLPYPGTLVKIGFVIGTTERLLIPESAISQRGEVTAVYVLAEEQQNSKINSTLSLRMVRLGSKTSDHLYPVLAGLSVGEKIAVDPIAAASVYQQITSSNLPRSNRRVD